MGNITEEFMLILVSLVFAAMMLWLLTLIFPLFFMGLVAYFAYRYLKKLRRRL